MSDDGAKEQKKQQKKREKETVESDEAAAAESPKEAKKREKETVEEEQPKADAEETKSKSNKKKKEKEVVDQDVAAAESPRAAAGGDEQQPQAEERTKRSKKSKEKETEERKDTSPRPAADASAASVDQPVKTPRRKEKEESSSSPAEEHDDNATTSKKKAKPEKKADDEHDEAAAASRKSDQPAVGGKLFLKVSEIKEVSAKPKEYYAALFFDKEEQWRTKIIAKKTTFDEGGRLHALPTEDTEKVPIRIVLYEKGLVGSLLDSVKGEVHLTVSELKDGYPHDQWFPLMTKKGETKGEMHLQVMYIPADVNDANGEEFIRPLHVLMKKSRLDLFNRMLSDPVCDIEQVDDEGRTALLLAVEMDRPAYVDALLKKGADPKKQMNNKKMTALHIAAQFRARKDIVRALLEKKADPLAKDVDNENTPLHVAAATDHVDALELMLAVKKIDVDVKNKQGESPLCSALRNSSSGAVKILLRKGADIYLANDNALTVWELSQRKEYVNTEPRKVFMEELNVHDPREFPLRTKYPEKKIAHSKRVHLDYAKSTQLSITVTEKTKAALLITTQDALLKSADFSNKTGFVVLKSDQGKRCEASVQLPTASGIGGAKPLTMELEPGFFYNVVPYSKSKDIDGEYSLIVLTEKDKPCELNPLVNWKYCEEQENDWTGKNAGGASQYDTFKNNVQYEITFPKEDNVEFAVYLSQDTNDPKTRMVQGADHKISTYGHNIGFYVMDRSAAKVLDSTGSWTDRRDVIKYFKMDFSERNHLTIVPCTYKPGEESPYTLKVFCDQEIFVKAK